MFSIVLSPVQLHGYRLPAVCGFCVSDGVTGGMVFGVCFLLLLSLFLFFSDLAGI